MGLSKEWKTATLQYKILKLIGQGVYGQVAKAKHRQSGMTVSIKMISVDASNWQSMKYLIREI